MNSREFTRMAIGLLFVIAPRLAMAQATSSLGTMAPNVPVFASGVMLPTTPEAEEGPENVFRGSLSLSANYDDNVLGNVTSGREWDVDYSIMPEISFTETRSRVQWRLDYSPGVNISQRYLYRNVFTQMFGGNVVWRISPHGTLSAEQSYAVTTDPFAGITTTAPGPVIGPNETIYIPNVRQTWLLSHALYSYQSSAQTTMGAGGTYSLQQFDSIPASGPTTPLIHSQIASGEAFIARQLTTRNQLGFQYGVQVLKFQQTDARTTAHSFLIFDQMNFSPHNVLTVYGGPEYSLTFNQVALNLGFVVVTIPVQANKWTGSGGVMYNWTGQRLAGSISISRAISAGEALIGAVELTAGTAKLSWQMGRTWSLYSTLMGADDQLLAVSNQGGTELRMYSAQAGISRQIGRNFGLNGYYERLNETGSIFGFALGNRDIVGASLQYSFLRPVGR